MGEILCGAFVKQNPTSSTYTKTSAKVVQNMWSEPRHQNADVGKFNAFLASLANVTGSLMMFDDI
jgi:hypothetical protein